MAKARNKPWLTYTMMAVLALVYALQVFSQTRFGVDWLAVWGMKWGPGIAAGQIWRLITPIFLHAGLVHLAFNLYALYVLGPSLEVILPKSAWLMLYFSSGLGSTALSFLMEPNPSLGASGAIFGLLGAQLLFFFRHRDNLDQGGRWGQLLFWVVLNLVWGATSPSIDNWGHIGGLLAGMLWMAVGGPWLQKVQELRDEASGATMVFLKDTRSSRDRWNATLVVALCSAVLVLVAVLRWQGAL